MKYKNGDIVRIKKGENIYEKLENFNIPGSTARDLLGKEVEFIRIKTRSGNDDYYYIEYKGSDWDIPLDCIEPNTITNWREVFEK